MKIIAHRGSDWQNNIYKENTLEAFNSAIKLGAEGIETDVRVTQDDKLILFHDRCIDDMPVSKMTFDSICKKLNYKVVTLEQFLDWAPAGQLLNLEIKSIGATDKILECIKPYKKKEFLMTSFWHTCVFNVGRLCSEQKNISCGVLVSCRPVLLQQMFAMIPRNLTHAVWDYEIYDPVVREKLSALKHFVYNVGNEIVRDVDGIISDNVKVHAGHKQDRIANTRTKKIYK